MELSSGRREIIVGLIDGPVAVNHPAFATKNIREISEKSTGACTQTNSISCLHGTAVAGVLFARRGSGSPAICPGCTLMVRPIFAEMTVVDGQMPGATPVELARAIIETVNAGARVINLSVAVSQPSTKSERELEESLNYAARKGVIIVAAAGNQGTVGGSAIIRHPWVIPVAACDLRGRLISQSNMGISIGRHGLCVPGENITSLKPGGKLHTFGGTSAAVPFVTGAVALLWSEFPDATAGEVKSSVLQMREIRRTTIVPPVLNAWVAYQSLKVAYVRR